KPFIYSRLDAKGLSTTVKQAKKLVEKEKPEVWDILDEVIREHPVLLNRAPTLHRLGIQAFEPVLIEGKAIQLHPLVCAAFNADFDGDQMAVHVPLSLEAQLEARVLMMSTNNILHPANGSPIIVPSQDIVLGLYYLSLMVDNGPGQYRLELYTPEQIKRDPTKKNIVQGFYRNISEVEHALVEKTVGLHSKIKYTWEGVGEDGKPFRKAYETTPGRALLSEVMPKHAKVPFDLVNKLMTKREISSMIDTVYRHCGQKETVIFCDRVMALGFHHAFKAGISFGKDDMVVPRSKRAIVEKTRELVKEFEQQYNDGVITQGEKYNKVVDAWSKCTKHIADEMMKEISATRPGADKNAEAQVNSIYMMAHSGARGSSEQMRQLAGMRGLMAKPSGEIIESPIISNFKEGLSVLEYFNSTHGARKGLADTALKTANSGYLTRRLVDVAQDCIITEEDCGTTRGIKVRAIIDAGQVVASLASRILGRTTAEDVRDPLGTKILVPNGTLLGEQELERLVTAGVQEVRLRSVLTCETTSGVCGKCYGRDLARGTPVNMGEAVGVIAAQSIGEPGTQLTMRTFHIGGAAQLSEQSFVESNFEGQIKIKNKSVVRNSDGGDVVMSRNLSVAVLDPDGTERAVHRIPYGARLRVNDGDHIVRGQRIAEWDPYTRPILTEVEGTVGFEDLIEGQSMSETLDETTGIAKRVVIDWRTGSGRNQQDLRPALVIKGKDGKILKLARGGDARYILAVDAVISVDPDGKVRAGDVVARIPTESAKTRDITGGLPRVAELFEARRPKESAVIAEISGTVRFGRDYKNKRRITIEPANKEEEPREYLVPKGKHIHLQDGDIIEKGDFIVEGNPAPHDILAIKGVEELAGYLVNEIQEVYRLQGVTINDKHIEVIVRQMLQKVEIDDTGETELIHGDQMDRIEFDELNAQAVAEGKKPATAHPVLLGITKASLQTRSFISAASFQETTRVLTEAAVNGKADTLDGLKENVIVGRLIPAGTGAMMNKVREIAIKRDQLILAEREREAALKAEAAVEPVALPAAE
ncbi:MAG: DNA-directed RNA polymerase subunit beta', partial [Xanthobacteraceae bacterium]